MRFTKIRLIGLTTVDLPIFGALPSNSYHLKAADGLGPPGVDVPVGNTASRRPQDREIVLRVGLNPNFKTGETAESLRTRLYGLLTPGISDVVQVQIMNLDNVIAETVGNVSRIEIVPFAKEPEVQITIPCPNQPYFRAPAEHVVRDLDLSIPGFYNVGTAPTGFHMELIFTGFTDLWRLLSADFKKRMAFEYDFIPGDRLSFTTVPGRRKIELTRGGVTTNQIGILTPDSTWFELHGGWNAWFMNFPSIQWVAASYTPLYWGI